MSGPLSLMVQSKFYEAVVTYREGASGPLREVPFTVITDSFAPMSLVTHCMLDTGWPPNNSFCF